MSKITFLGAGSTVFAKNVLGDCLLTHLRCKAMKSLSLILITNGLQDSANMLNNIKKTSGSTSIIKAYTDRKEASERCQICGKCNPSRWL
jgi:alpha-galactosidase